MSVTLSKDSASKVFSSDNWIITKVIDDGRDDIVRISAKVRYRRGDEPMFFNKWISRKYANRLALEHYGKPLSEFSVSTDS